jgi:hypothetical protein
MISLLFSIYLAITILLFFVNIRYGIAMFICYTILVPYFQFFSFGRNLFSVLILVALLYKYPIKSLVFSPLKPFLFLFFAQLLIIPFHDDISYSVQLNLIRSDFMISILLPFALINVMAKDEKAIKLFTQVLFISIFIAALYSLLLILTPGINPYLIILLPLSGEEFNEAYAEAFGGGRVFGRISGVFTHPMMNGLFLCLSFFFITSRIEINSLLKNKFKLILLLIIFASIITMGVRSAIGAVMVGFICYLLLVRKIKMVIIGLFIYILFIQLITFIPGMEEYINSMTEYKKDATVKGSSIELRLEQLNGGLNEIRNNYIFGKGYGWTDYYLTFRVHPTMWAFESLILVILCNNGFIGFFIWGIMILNYIRNLRNKFFKNDKAILISLLVTYLVYSVVTGEYSYLKYFLIFYSIIWVNGRQKFNLNKKKIKHEKKKSTSNSILSSSISSDS